MNLQSLNGIVPASVLSQITDDLINTYGINNELRMAHFLSQCSEESEGFTRTVENLNYSAQGLLNVFPTHFSNQDIAAAYARQPERIANRVYANRYGNGDEASGDGWKNRGRGYIMITFEDNYDAFERSLPQNIDIKSDPDIVSDTYPLLSAAWFFSSKGLNSIADEGATDDVVTKITKIINGGSNGLANRIQLFNQYYTALTRQSS